MMVADVARVVSPFTWRQLTERLEQGPSSRAEDGGKARRWGKVRGDRIRAVQLCGYGMAGKRQSSDRRTVPFLVGGGIGRTIPDMRQAIRSL